MFRFCKFVRCGILLVLVALCFPAIAAKFVEEEMFIAQLGPRPFYLLDNMDEGPLKEALKACAYPGRVYYRTDFTIGHRGAALEFPEHTVESYVAAARMGAGILECDVTFTKDKVLVCRHAQCDLHATTDILLHPELAAKCSQPFKPAKFDPVTGKLIEPASAKCCVSDITYEEFKMLKGKMDGVNPLATTVEEYVKGTPSWRTDLYSPGTLVSHAESIELFKRLGTKMTPELKMPEVEMPFDGYTLWDYAQQMIDEYKAAGVDPKNVFPQCFNLDVILYWIKNEPEFGKQAVFLDARVDQPGFDINDPSTWSPSMEELYQMGVRYIAPPMWALLTLDENMRIVPSEYAKRAKAAGLKIITWTLERSGHPPSGYYYQSIQKAVDNDGDVFVVLDVLAREVGIEGIFTDWPATVTFYANCMGLKLQNAGYQGDR